MSAGEAGERRAAVLEALVVGAGAPVSGEELASRLGCSRAAVHRHVEALRRDGVHIEGGAEGYSLDPASDVVVPALVQRELTGPLAGPVAWRASTASTNDDAAAAAREGAAEGLVVGADRQTAGRGRRGRPWVSRAGEGLFASVLLRPSVAPVDASTLPLLVALGVAEACGEQARIAWPNDIVIAGRKVAGVLVELSADHERVHWAIAGVGVNVRGAPELADARWTPGALGDGRGRSEILIDLMRSLGRRYADWCGTGRQACLAAYRERDALAGRTVTVTTDDGEIVGTASGVDEAGRLRMATAAGERQVSVGEVTGVDGL